MPNYSLSFGSLLNLSPRGNSDLSTRSRDHCNRLKQGAPLTVDKMVLAVKKKYDEGMYRDILGPDRILVPVPGHAPLVDGGLWVPYILAEKFVREGLGKEVMASILREYAVAKSSNSRWGERPTVLEHLKSLKLNQTKILTGGGVTLIDDVITKGATIYACYALLKTFLPDLNISSFAIFKTQGYIAEIEKILEPTEGVVSYNKQYEKIKREP